MGLDYILIKTNAGLTLDQKLPNSGNPLKLVRAESGAGRVAASQLENLQAITDPMQELELKDLLYPKTGEGATLTIPVEVNNRGLETEYTLYQIGVYAEDPDLGEILYLVAQFQAEKGERIPTEANAPGFSSEYHLTTKTANAEKVEVAVSDAGTLTIEQADNRYSKREQQLPATLQVDTWNPETKTYSFEETYPSETYNLNIEPIDCTQEQAEAWGAILPMGSSRSNVLTALGEVPAVDIPVLLTIKRT